MSEMKFKNTSIMHEFLSNCSDETVYKFLLKEDPQIWNNEITLKMLLAKDNALINLALAQTTNSFSVLKKLYKKNNEALRIACLGNSNIYNLDFDPFKRGIIPAMSSIFFTHDEYTNFITNSKNPNELIAVLTNKKFDLDNLANLYEKKDKPYISLDESRFMDLVYFTIDNPNLYLPSEDPLSWVGTGHDRRECSRFFFNIFNIVNVKYGYAIILNNILNKDPNIIFDIPFDKIKPSFCFPIASAT